MKLELVAQILEDLNRRISFFEMDDEGGGYQSAKYCQEMIEKLQTDDC